MQRYRYSRAGIPLAFYRDAPRQSSPPPPDVTPPATHRMMVVRTGQPLDFDDGQPDIRGFLVSTPNGDTLGMIAGLLADTAHATLPLAYVTTTEDRTVVVPTDYLTIFAAERLVTLAVGKTTLEHAPAAQYHPGDAERAIRYWMETWRRDAA